MQASNKLITQHCLEDMCAALEAAGLYFGHGTDNAWDEACWLLETVLKRKGVSQLRLDSVLTVDHLQDVTKLLHARISSHKPLAYLLQEAWFCGLLFYVDERVLVPRSPLAELIRNQFEPLLTVAPTRILDLCTGGGCIGIACAMAFPDAAVVLSDISAQALEVTAINISKFKLAGRVSALKSDLFESVTDCFDLIVSNPPYVAVDEYENLPAEYHCEPELGLVTGKQGLEIPLLILQQAAKYLNPHGVLLLETGATWPALVAACPQVPFIWIEFECGGEGVCMLTKEQLVQYF